MASRFVNPFPQYLDATPEVRAGALLFFYEAGTSTKLDTYSDRTLSTANTNPVVLNSAGYPAVDIYLQDLDYKVVLAPSTDTDPPASAIWSADYVRGRDSALIAKTLTGSGSPNGSVAGTAGSASILPDFYWDYTNSILYVCTTTGTSSTAVWTAVNASSATAAVPPPQGRLTPTSSTPIITTGVSSGTAVYYTPYNGNLVPIYNGTSMIPTEFSELTLTLVASHAANTLYDVFVFSNSGVLTLVTGPAWATSTAGSGARGTGASTTELTRIKGLWVNAVSMTARNGSTTYPVGANLATYVGSIFIDGSAGQVTCQIAWGQLRRWAVWNAYNRSPIILKVGDSTASWTYNSATVRASRGDSNNNLKTFTGLPEEFVDLQFMQLVTSIINASNAGPRIAIGVNSTTTSTGFAPVPAIGQAAASNSTVASIAQARHMLPPSLGVNTINSLESESQAVTSTFSGGEANMLLSAKWLG
jgi:hypothetical protein